MDHLTHKEISAKKLNLQFFTMSFRKKTRRGFLNEVFIWCLIHVWTTYEETQMRLISRGFHLNLEIFERDEN